MLYRGIPASASLLLTSLLLLASSGAGARDPARPAGAKMTRAEFDRLPPDSVLDVGGKKMSKRDFLAQFDRLKKTAGPSKGKGDSLESLRRRRERGADARVAADSARARAMTSKLGGLKSVCPEPVIQMVLHVPPVEPGEEFLVGGCGFGSSGQIKLHLAEGAKLLEPLVWKGTYIAAKVPKSLEGVLDQKGSIRVTQAGKTSAPFPMEFRAARAIKALKRSEISVDCAAKSGDTCDPPNSYTTLVAYHTYSTFDLGVDKVSASVKNGWEFVQAPLKWSYGYYHQPPSSQVAAMNGFSPGGTSTQFTVFWQYIGMGGIRYDVSLLAEGPKGTNYK